MLANVSMEQDGDIVFLTVGKYKLFMANGKIGIDAMSLYMHYQFTCRLQKTISIKANTSYCCKGLGWGDKRFGDAKALLIELRLIQNVIKRDEKGKISGAYIMVYTTTPPVSPEVDVTSAGFQGTNALTKKINTITKKINTKGTVRKPKPPENIEEVNEYCKSIDELSFPADTYFLNYESQDWIKANGQPILNWKSHIRYLVKVGWGKTKENSYSNYETLKKR